MRSYFINIVLVLVLVIGLGAWLFSGSDDTEQQFRTDKITRGDIAQIVTATGTLNPVEVVNVGTQVSGKLTQIYVSLNDEVKEGQLLAEVDPALSEASLKQSRASLESAKLAFEQAGRDLERTKTLVGKDYLARVELERAQQSYLSARNSYDSAKAQVERDETNLSYTRITSPIDGVIIGQDVSSGQTVAASFQTPNLFRIAGSLTEMKIDVSMPEADIGKVRKDMEVSFTVDAFPDRKFSGIVQTINLNPVTQQNIVTYTVTVIVKNEDKVLLPGMTAYVDITMSETKDVLRAPLAAIRFVPPEEKVSPLRRLFTLNPGGRRMMPGGGAPNQQTGPMQTIYLLKDGMPEPVDVKTGASDDTYIQIEGEGVEEGDTVITGIRQKRG